MKLFILLILFIPLLALSQNKKTYPKLKKINWTGKKLDVKQNSLLKKSIIPLSLCATGLILNQSPLKNNMQKSILKPFNGYHTKLDDYIQYAPIVELYTFDLLKIPARNSVWNQTKFLVISELTTAGIIHLLKNTTKIKRPDGSSNNSFASGHTGQAFVTSQVLFNEYFRTKPLIGLSGYLFSVSTGALRVTNNRHWVPDVVMGAGVAILITNLVYHFEPLKNWNPWRKNNINTSFTPVLQPDLYGFNFKMNW